MTKLQKEDWRCHIVAHSHGGNVVVEALPKIMTAAHANGLPGKIVTLGTPFIDTMSPILKRAKLRARILGIASWIPFGVLPPFFAISIAEGISEHPSLTHIPFFYLWVFATMCVFAIIWLLSRRRDFRRGRRDLGETERSASIKPGLLALGSMMDEAWQLIHHLRSIDNPLGPRTNLFTYLFASMRSHVSQRAEVSFIHGAKSLRDLGQAGKFGMIYLLLIFHGTIIFGIPLIIMYFLDPVPFNQMELAYRMGVVAPVFSLFLCYLVVLLVTRYAGETFHSAFWSPYRRLARIVGSLGSVLPGLATYIVRRKGWSVLLAMAMGLEGYRHRFPMIEQHPTNVPQGFVKYENMPEDAEQRALAMRDAWIARHFGDVARTLSNMVVTAADISSLLREVEADQSLVHAAYYTDDSCVARVADWIAGRE